MRALVNPIAVSLLLVLTGCTTPGPALAFDLRPHEGARARAIGGGTLLVHNKGPGYVQVAWSRDPSTPPDELEWTELPSWADASRSTRGDLTARVRNGISPTTVGFAVKAGTALDAVVEPAESGEPVSE